MENENVPSKFKPLSAWEYLGYQLLFAIPFIGLILLIIFALNDDNINRRNFARSYFCGMLIGVIIFTIALMLGAGAFFVAAV